MSLAERIAKHIETQEKPNFLWYALLVEESDVDQDQRAEAFFVIRTSMEKSYNLQCAADAEELLRGGTENQ